MRINLVWTYHYKGVANPERVPAVGALWDHDGLTVNCYHHGWSFTHSTPVHVQTHTMSTLSHTHLHTVLKETYGQKWQGTC